MKASSLALAPDHSSLLPGESFAQAASTPHTQLWAGIHFPALALEVSDFTSGLPALIIDASGGRQTIYSACEVAMDHGIMPGMSLNAAHALCHNLDVKLRDPEAEYQRLQSYSEQLLCFTPSISLGQWLSGGGGGSKNKMRRRGVTGPEDNADTLLLELSASLKLFGGLELLLQRIRAEFASTEVIISAAPCASGALLMARSGMETVMTDPGNLKSVLGAIPLRIADLDHKLVEKLGRCGLNTLRDLWRLPREDLGRRFGRPLLDYLDRLSGARSEAIAHIDGPLCFRQRMALPADTRHSKLIVMAAEKLLEEARCFLQRHAAATAKIGVDLWHVNRHRGSRSRTTITVQSAEADRHPGRFMPQLIEQLACTPLEDEVDAVSIVIDQVVPYARTTEDLFSRRDQQALDWSQLMDLMAARIGQDKVYTLKPVADHRPEYAWDRSTLPGTPAVDDGLIDSVQQTLPVRPLWLLDAPRRIQPGTLQLGEDTERIEAGWWSRRDLRRDYRIARAKTGQCGWVYRDLHQGRSDGDRADAQGWYLHGLFA